MDGLGRSAAIGKIRGLMQQTVQAQTVSIEWVGGQLTRELAEFLLDVFRHPHIKDALHQRFDGEEMGIDVFQISHRLLKSVRWFIHTAARGGMHLTLSGTGTVLFLKVFQNTTGERAE